MSVVLAFLGGVFALLVVFGILTITWLFVTEFRGLYRKRRWDRRGSKRRPR